jgi:hypothetical protein
VSAASECRLLLRYASASAINDWTFSCRAQLGALALAVLAASRMPSRPVMPVDAVFAGRPGDTTIRWRRP